MIKMADDELQETIVPVVFGLRADHFLDFTDYTTTDDVDYEIPESALNRNLRSVCYVDERGVESRLTPVEYDDEAGAVNYDRRSFAHGAYYIRGDMLKLYPSSTPGKTLRLHYYRLPNKLVPIDQAAKVTDVDYDTGVVTTSGVPATWTTDDVLCCVAGRPGFRLRFAAKKPTDVSSPTVTFAAEDVAEIAVGDWLALEGDSPIPQIPVEAHRLLAQATLVKVLEAHGDDTMEKSQKKLDIAIARYQNMATPRVEEDPKSVVSRANIRHFIS